MGQLIVLPVVITAKPKSSRSIWITPLRRKPLLYSHADHAIRGTRKPRK